MAQFLALRNRCDPRMGQLSRLNYCFLIHKKLQLYDGGIWLVDTTKRLLDR
jgi:hypothetical protein